MPKGKGQKKSGASRFAPKGGSEKLVENQKGKIPGQLSLRGIAKTKGFVKGVE